MSNPTQLDELLTTATASRGAEDALLTALVTAVSELQAAHAAQRKLLVDAGRALVFDKDRDGNAVVSPEELLHAVVDAGRLLLQFDA